MSSTKILVFRLKEIIYTVLFIGMGILLIVFLIFMFTNKKTKEVPASYSYIPGIYTASAMLDNQPVQVEVTLDQDHINSINILNLDTTMQTLYPLLETSMESLESQIVNQTMDQPVHIQPEIQYTSTFLLDVINKALSKARLEP